MMDRTIFIVSADSAVAQECIKELTLCGGRYRLPVVFSVTQARAAFRRTAPVAVFLDESAVNAQYDGGSFESAVALLTETAPVVVAAAPERQSELAFLITSGVVDFVTRTDHFLQIAAGLLDRRAHLSERAAGTIQFPNTDLSGDFGEILRHEVNNPLTGILGNTELLLARPDRLPPGAVERLRTIAELAVRLRETVRRLSNSCEEHHEAARPA
jgi:signal transduction histidine kinase